MTEPNQQAPPPITTTGEHPLPPLQGITVLVVDDDETSRVLLVDVLTFRGARVIAAASAEEALDTLIRERADVLLSDIGLPQRDGFWLIAQVRALPPDRGRDTPAAAITGHFATEENRAAILRAGFKSYVSKPFPVEQLVAVVRLLARPR